MKKLLLMAFAAVFTLGANAQEHLEWTAASLPQTLEDAYALGYQDYWSMGYCIPGDYVLCESSRFKAYIEKPFICTTGNSGYSGASRFAFKPLMGMNNSTRSGIESLYFFEGLENNDYLRQSSYSNEGVEYTYYDAIVTLEVAPAEENTDGIYAQVSLTYNRGGNNSAMYVVDATANSGEGMMVLQSVTRGQDGNPQDHVARFGVEPGHTYYVMASEKASVELYGITYDECASDSYEQLISEDNCTGIWTAASLPQTLDDAYALGYQDYWAMGYCIPGDYALFEDGDFSAYIEKPFICTTGNSGYSGRSLYAFKPLMGMNNSTRSGIESLYFFEGLENNDYVRESSYSNEGVEYSYTDAIVTLKVAEAAEGTDGTYGRVTLNYNRGGNNSAMYVVDATANSGEGMMVLQTVTRCPNDAVKTHAPQFNVEPGHTYYVMASEKGSVELYGIGFCPVSSEKYSSTGTTGIQNFVASPVTVNDNKIYSIDGRYLGTEKGNLGKGLYIMNGKKFVVK